MLKKSNILRKLNKCLKKMTAPYVKLDTPLSEHTVVCRGCLADCGEMKDIREWGLIEDFRKYTGIQLRRSDGVSELMCTTCEDSLRMCKLFEQQCKKSDMALRSFAMLRRSDGVSELMCTTCEDSLRMCKLFEQQCKKSDMALRSFAMSKSDNTRVDENSIVFQFNEKKLIFTIIAPDQDMNLNFPCPYNCRETYTKKNDLLNHLIRTHNHNKDYEIDYHYHCWQRDCIYNKNSGKDKFFSGRKYMNQHYNKVHKSKIFHCDKCEIDFATTAEFNRHHNTCTMVFSCEECSKVYNNRDRLLVHLMRRHPDKHREYKDAKKAEKRKAVTQTITKKPKMASVESLFETDSPKRSFATQTLNLKDTIKNDVTLSPWQSANNEISTQTGFEDLLSLKSNSEDESLFYSETTLSDIQTQTFPLEFGLVINRSHKETLTETLDISIKGTQTYFCYFDSPKVPFGDLESVSSSPRSGKLTSTETQTADYKSSVKSDVLLSLNSTETQTCFEEAFKESL